MQRLVIALVTAVLAVLLAGACVPASAAGVYLVPVYDLSASAYDGVAAQRAGAPSEEAPVASNGVSDGVQVTLPTPPGPLSPLLSASTAANTASLEARVAEVHGVLDPIAQTSRTTAALGTREGTTVIGGGVRELSPAQRALIGDGEMMAGGPGHAEVTTVLGARGAGLTPQEIVTSWDICPTCQTFLLNEGATLTGPRSASW